VLRALGKPAQECCILLAVMASMLLTEIEITPEEKRAALQFALNSESLSRSDRLKSLLSYLCEAEFSGTHNKLTEYDIAVSALGRRSDFSPVEDSTVRSRTYELRQKLEKLYASEAPEYPIRIDIPKGSYRPKFHSFQPPPVQHAPPFQVDAPAPSAVIAKTKRHLTPTVMLAFLAGVVLTILFILLFFGPLHGDGRYAASNRDLLRTPELQELWKPLISGTRPLLIAFETRLFAEVGPVVVRDPQVESILDVESSRPIMQIKQLFNVSQVYEARRYSDFSVANAVFSMAQLLAQTGISASALRSTDLTEDDIHADNLILIGKPGAYEGIQHVPFRANFVFQKDRSIKNLRPLPGELASYSKSVGSAASGGLTEEYGLITLDWGIQKGQHILYLEGAESELYWPLGLYLTQPAYAKELVSHLRRPSGKLPGAYQVVVKAEFRGGKPINVSYVTHRVISVQDQ
jgi:hypothetical protein